MNGGPSHAGREQGIANVPLSLEKLFCSFAEFLRTQTEHGGKVFLINTAQKLDQSIVRQFIAIGVQQGVFVSLAALKGKPFPRPIDDLSHYS